jgi:hypothetical protein
MKTILVSSVVYNLSGDTLPQARKPGDFLRFCATAIVYKKYTDRHPSLSRGCCSILPNKRKTRQLYFIHVVVQPRLSET